MSMQIGQMMRSLLGEVQPTEAKTLELKAGEVVKGMVLQLLGEQDAIVNIGGVHVRAKLESPLQQGQVTFLQVQPESNGSQTVLKPVGVMPPLLTDDSLTELLLKFGIKDGAQARQLGNQLQQAGIPLTRENVQRFADIVKAAPADVPADQSLEAAIVASKRNLPLTREAVQSLREAMFGQPLTAQLDRLEGQAQAALRALAQLPEAQGGELRELLEKLAQAMRAVKEASGSAGGAAARSALPESQAGAGQGRPDGGTAVQGKASEPAGQAGSSRSFAAETARSGPEQRAPVTEPTGQTSRHGATEPLSAGRQPNAGDQLAEGTGKAPVPAERQEGRQPAAGSSDAARSAADPEGRAVREPPRTQPGQPALPARPSTAAGEGERGLSASGSHGTEKADSSPDNRSDRAAAREGGHEPARAQPKSEDHWIGRLLKAVGMDNEHQISRAVARAEHGAPPAHVTAGDALPGADAGPTTGAPSAGELQRHAAADSLKSVLLQLGASQAVPEALREQAQQAVQHITGQQLLLSADRSAVLTHVTLLLPVRHEGGEQTAAVHVQSRKGRKGEIDAQNCRLLFDLNMHTLGSTLVDVQVYDRKVYLQVHNDTPVLGLLLERYRGEIEQGLLGNGYRCMSLQCSPFPKPAQPDGVDGMTEAASAAMPGGAASAYRVKPYKGVDMRV
ncbi:hypothetical protein ACFFNY_24675 [Paenibacillus hodogayensis]|uniref:Flagellar hook-length control protein-like C-terminal domain-containing protein n=1 Tax=Paenibacillus hodogayensis TaxID=279208 RepID=A0ABV5W2J9_9BACL